MPIRCSDSDAYISVNRMLCAVGGEFPVAASSASERAESTEKLKALRGQTVVLVFSMQALLCCNMPHESPSCQMSFASTPLDNHRQRRPAGSSEVTPCRAGVGQHHKPVRPAVLPGSAGADRARVRPRQAQHHLARPVRPRGPHHCRHALPPLLPPQGVGRLGGKAPCCWTLPSSSQTTKARSLPGNTLYKKATLWDNSLSEALLKCLSGDGAIGENKAYMTSGGSMPMDSNQQLSCAQ